MGKSSKCCAACFGDRYLTERIEKFKEETGKCGYCETENAALVDPSSLADWFWLLTGIYELDDNGRSLVEWLKEDWDLFCHDRMDKFRSKDLLAEILGDVEIVRHPFAPSAKYESDGLSRWEQLRDELMYTNRYFPRTKLDESRLARHLPQLKAEGVQSVWYRARLQTSENAYPLAEMGAPPKRMASHGRANPAGIPYLYLGSTAETAASEVRPHTGETACVADFVLSAGLGIIDLRDPRRLVSPFPLESEEKIAELRSDIGLLERLGQELTTPIVPQGAPIDYVPSQYLCEFIKNCGYEGVIYRSSVSDGMNLALFAPERATPGTVKQYSIDRVSVAVRAMI